MNLIRLPFQLLGGVVLSVAVVTTAASEQFTPVVDIPATPVFSVSANGNTIAAGIDVAVYVSTDAGGSWRRSATPVAGVSSIQATVIQNGRLFAGTFGQGVFVSDNLGVSWQSFNQGLVGGVLNSQLFITDLVVRGDSIFASTSGAGVYVRRLTAPSMWSPSGVVWEPNQASNVNSLALGGSRLLAMAGSNGSVFTQDPGEADWTLSNLDNVGLRPGLQSMTAAFTGTGWVVGTALGPFRSITGREPWTRTNLNMGPLIWTAFATQGRHLFGAFNTPILATFMSSNDDGATWQSFETMPGVFVMEMVVVGNNILTARGDGLWRRSIGSVSVAEGVSNPLRFAVAGTQPFGDQARLRFDMPEPGAATIEVFDVAGRQAGEPIKGWWSSGTHEVSFDARRLSSGVYAARLTAGSRHEVVRLVHVQ